MTSIKKEFLDPVCTVKTLDIFIVRRAILEAIRAELGEFHGIFLDIGSGFMPYKSLILAEPSRVHSYIGLDLRDNLYQTPDIEWDGQIMPFADNSIDCAMATEVFEHCPDPEQVMREACRVLKPGGVLFFSVPFLWPLHTVPFDQYRYTPWSLMRHLTSAGFTQVVINPLGGWDASLAQMLGLWARRRYRNRFARRLLPNVVSAFVLPIVWLLSKIDSPPCQFYEGAMMAGFSGTARKPLG